ncbi:MAG: replicative DNA helicase [Planctomycetota bacterium]
MADDQGRDHGGGNGRPGGSGRRDRAVFTSVERLFDKLPPHSLEAEMSLLGSMILDPQVIADVLPVVGSPESFYSSGHAAIYKGILQLYDQHQAGDLVMLVDVLRNAGQLDDIGGEQYLVDLAEGVPAPTSAVYYARTVADKHRLRSLIEASGKILYEAYHPGEGAQAVNEVIDAAESKIFAIAEQSQSDEAQSLEELLQEEIEHLEAIEGKGVSGIPTGYLELDDMLTGLHAGEMIIVAARPSMGKTALALNIAEQVAMGGASLGNKPKADKCAVALFSVEMSKSAVTSRMLSARSGVDSHKMRSGRFTQDDFQRLIRASGDLAEAPIYIDDTPSLSILGLRARSRRLARKHNIGCIVIDYLQLLSSPGAARESRQVEVSEISRGIKALARELDVPVICLAQLNRGPEQREGKQPRISDLRESGSIEQDADVVLLLHREEYYHIGDEDWQMDNPDKLGLAELIVAKQRNGPTGVVKLTWDSQTTRFKNHAESSGGGYGVGAGYGGGHSSGHSSGHGAGVGYGGSNGASYSEPKPRTEPTSETATHGTPPDQSFGGFGNRPKTGPAEDHRDGGGPTEFDGDEFDGDEVAPF